MHNEYLRSLSRTRPRKTFAFELLSIASLGVRTEEPSVQDHAFPGSAYVACRRVAASGFLSRPWCLISGSWRISLLRSSVRLTMLAFAEQIKFDATEKRIEQDGF